MNTENNIKIVKRTFKALEHPKGSAERNKLNKNIETSQYMKSYKYAVIGPNFTRAFKTESAATTYMKSIEKKTNTPSMPIYEYELGKEFYLMDSKDMFHKATIVEREHRTYETRPSQNFYGLKIDNYNNDEQWWCTANFIAACAFTEEEMLIKLSKK